MDHHRLLKAVKSPFFRNEPMSLHTTWKAGGPADIFIGLACREDLDSIRAYSRQNSPPYGVTQEEVFRQFGISLEPEVRIISN